MHIEISTAGKAALQAGPLPLSLKQFVIGSDYAYIPGPSDTGVRGATLFTGLLSEPVIVNPNTTKYSLYLDYNVGPFAFGEVAMYLPNGDFFGLAVTDVLIKKLRLDSQNASAVRIDFYISMVDENYTMWFDLAESNNQFKLAVLGGPDQLPSPQNAVPNAYVVTGADENQVSTLAFTDRNGLWNFDAYAYANLMNAAVLQSTSLSVTIPLTMYAKAMSPAYFGQLILQFTTGELYGTCRYIDTTTLGSGVATMSFKTPLAKQPKLNDKFVIFVRQSLSTRNSGLPIATQTIAGIVKIGEGIKVETDGTISVDLGASVKTVNDKEADEDGNIALVADDIPGIDKLGKTGEWADIRNKPTTFPPPIATTTILGGVKQGEGVKIAADGTLSAVPYELKIASTTTLGGIKVGNGLTIDADGKLSTSGSTYTLPTASASVLGGIKIGSGLAISGSGVVSATSTYELLPATTTTLGGIKVGTGLTIDTDGKLNSTAVTYTLPAASASTLGGVKIGTGITITSDGTISTSFVPADYVKKTGDLMTGPLGTKGLTETIVSVSSSGGSVTIDMTQSTYYAVSLTAGANTLTLNGAPSDGATGITLEMVSPGSSTLTWPTKIKWEGGTIPTTVTGTMYVILVTKPSGTINGTFTGSFS